ncbi:stress-response A/B barrel domain-containing protein UP3-like [Nymphaea colorata]|uniref:Stress-response A/B barrel domain-containing protein n=1 Tax=Nymphaea colorata TaxID=210225 RepID=A0A5K1FV35_9MAGN|nr:stress-response A/B barrel domain-containing protein UP3-like [Nymphaea colorata]
MLLRLSASSFLHQNHFRAASIFGHPIPGRKSHRNLSFPLPRAAAAGRGSMSTAAATTHDPSSVVEHIVLFDVKPETETEKVEAMLSGLRSLSSLETVLYLTAGPIHRLRSSSLGFTHLLYGRYPTKQALADYSAHPSHVKVVQERVLPISRDVMAVDWVADLEGGPAIPSATAAFRLTLVKPRPDLDEASQKEIGQVLEGIRCSLPSSLQVSFGENFSPARAKGFGWGLMSFFPGVDGINAIDSDEDLVKAQKEKVKDLVDSVIVVDYEYPQPIPPLPPSL